MISSVQENAVKKTRETTWSVVKKIMASISTNSSCSLQSFSRVAGQ